LDVQLSKKAKIIILIVLIVAAAPLYACSNPGLDKITKSLWEKGDDPETPKKIYWITQLYAWTWREDKGVDLAKEWLRHYGGDETDKAALKRWDSWDPPKDPDGKPMSTYPWDETGPRPPQKGEDYRPEPHPLTGKVLIFWANHLEDVHQLQQAVHIYELLNDENYCNQWKIQRDPEVAKAALAGITRNSSGNRSF